MIEKYISFFETSFNYELEEKLYRINQDVDYIYNNSFKNFVDDFKANNLQPLNYYKKSSEGDFMVLFSSDLKTIDCKKAHKVNPITIYCGYYQNSMYDFSTEGNKESSIIISISKKVVDKLYSGTFPQNSDTSKNRRTINEITEKRLKSSIAHELTHWLDDSLHKIYSRIIKPEMSDEQVRILLKYNKELQDVAYPEIQAQIHGVYQVKRKYTQQIWDQFSLQDLFELPPTLTNIIALIKTNFTLEISKTWLKSLLKRLSRENLLGKNMTKSFDIDKLLKENFNRVHGRIPG